MKTNLGCDKMIRTFNKLDVELYHDDIDGGSTNGTVGTSVTIETNGQAMLLVFRTFKSSSKTINGNTDTVNVGTALTLGHSQGLQFFISCTRF